MSDPDLTDEGAEPAGPPWRHIRSFAMRRGHITQGQRRAYEERFPAFGVPYAAAPLDFAQVFGRRAPTVLEIGFGMGETTAEIAAAHPERDFAGIEVHAPGVGSLLRELG